jgi:hypothetical protein
MLSRHLDSLRLERRNSVGVKPGAATLDDIGYQCWCCSDSGLILIRHIREFLIADYGDLDVPMVCKRCTACSEKFDSIFERLDARASAADCERIHAAVLKEAKDAAKVIPFPVHAAVSGLAHSKGLNP